MFVEPMLARAAQESDLSTKDWTGWTLEPKHDGMRAIIERTEDGVEIYSRTGKSQKGKCPHIEESFINLPIGTILDGELAIVVDYLKVDDQYVPVVDFNKTMRVMGSGVDKAVLRQQEFGPIQFLAFDVIQYGDNDVTSRPQEHRSIIVNAIQLVHLIHNPQYTGNFEAVYNELIAAGVEGAILKNNSGVYKSGRNRDWLKVKSAKTFDVIVSGFTDGQGKYDGQIGAIEFSAYMPDGSLRYVGRCSGMTDVERDVWTTIRDNWGTPLYSDQIIIEVKANEMVGSGEYKTPRHPQYVTQRIDKHAKDCTMEQFKA